MDDVREFLKPGRVVDSDHDLVRSTAAEVLKGHEGASDVVKAGLVFEFARDQIRFSPWERVRDESDVRASSVLATRKGFCAHKGVTLAALARAAGIPAKVGALDLRNHQAAERLKTLLKTNVFIGGAFTDMYLGGRWVRFTPVFNRELCDKMGWPVISFDGRNDAIFPPVLKDGRPFIEILKVHGSWHDWPHELFKKLVTDFYSAESLKEWERIKVEKQASGG